MNEMLNNTNSPEMNKFLENIENNPEEVIKNIDNVIMKNELKADELERSISRYKQSILELNDPELNKLVEEIESNNYSPEEVSLKIQEIKDNTMNTIKELLANDKNILDVLVK